MASRRAPHAASPLPPSAWASGVPLDWVDWPDEALLDLPLKALPITIAGSWLDDRIATLDQELAARRLDFRPHYWLSSEWFSPDGVPGIAIPFYLAHPRLMKLEQAQMLEVEGGTPAWCLRILRHEAGHAIDNAYTLRRRRRRVQLFGRPSEPYPEFYLPRPYSRSFVMHLDAWYAQSHPDEDFAETFAVWLSPEQDWRARYAGWPALRKIEYMDGLMTEIAGRPPVVSERREVEPLAELETTLRAHYAAKREHYGLTQATVYDRDLRKLFSDDAAFGGNRKASRFMASVRREVRRLVAEWTGAYQYTIDQVIAGMMARADELGLRLMRPEDRTRVDFTLLLTVQTMHHLHSGRHRLPL